MECYIKCPPDKNISLAVGKGSTTFDVERPVTNYDWDRYLLVLFKVPRKCIDRYCIIIAGLLNLQVRHT